MGKLFMDATEHEFWEEEIAEAARLLGQECKLYQVDIIDEDINRDTKVSYKEPVSINILFEDNPKPKLKKLGWLTETDDLPYLAYITSLDDNYERVKVDKYAKITVLNNLGEVDLQISEVSGSEIDPLFWICKLVPYRYNFDDNAVDKDSSDYNDASITSSSREDGSNPNYNYLKRR